ncbi:MAG: hypothetical protein Q7T26_09295 [Dehalococcoidia bacterium]|nr:hypothetical protein [Dehalococcoidia bacterium]
MSKLVERLEKLAHGVNQPMGFGFHAAQPKTPSLLTIALLDKENPRTAAAAASAGADFIVVPVSAANIKDLGATFKAAESVSCGVLCHDLSAEHIPALKEAGCDFLVFEPQQAPMSILRDEEMGKVLVLDNLMEDTLAATAEQLEVDAVLLDLGDPPLTIQRVMVFQRTAGLTSKSVIAVVPATLSIAEVEVLRDMGVQGLAVRVKDVKSAEAISDLRKAAEGLAPPKKKKMKANAIVPRIALRTAPDEDGEEEEEEE